VLLSTDLPTPGSSGDRALRAATAADGAMHAVMEVADGIDG
jgi:hypothetical protein